jgi:hypothetical protein
MRDAEGINVCDEISVVSQSGEPPQGRRTITADELQGHIDRARRLRTEFIAGLLRRGLGGMVRLLRRLFGHRCAGDPNGAPAAPGHLPLNPPAVTTGLPDEGETRHAPCSNRAA